MGSMIPGQATGSERAVGKATPFLWGVATSGYQVEGFGGPFDGKNVDNTQWANWPVEKSVGEATGFLTRGKYKVDVALAAGLGAKAFRIGIEWSRLQPTRETKVESFDFSFYDDLINTIKGAGMEPVVTLLHSTYPYWLQNELGWDKPGQFFPPKLPPAVQLYLNFVQAVVKHFGKSVTYWITFNEPNIWVLTGWLLGLEPPGMKDLSKTIQVARNVIMAHRLAYDLIHRINRGAQVSANIYCLGFQPQQEIFQERTFEADWVYPAIIDKVDFVSLDYYWKFSTIAQFIAVVQSPWDWPHDPQGLYDVIMVYWDRYRKPILIAENGLATYGKTPRKDGLVRSVHLKQHTDKLLEARDVGKANVIGYLYWSITDNWEWGGIDDRSGLYWVDVNDPTRIFDREPAADLPTDPKSPTYAVDTYRKVIYDDQHR